MTTALVTGAYGFVGRHVARALASRGTDVVAIGHGTWGRDEWRDWGIVEWHQADVTLNSLVTYGGQPDAIFHCAGSGSVGFSMSHPQQDFERTVTATLAVLEYMRTERPAAALVLPSSAGVYGAASKMPISIVQHLEPVSPYGVHKKISEDLCRSYGRNFGIGSSIVRLFSVYGDGLRKQLLWDACAKLTKGKAQFAGTGAETRDWLHVEDAASLMILASHQATPEVPVANGGSGAATSIRTIVYLLAEGLGTSCAPEFSGVVRPGDPQHYQADVTEAHAWGWRPTRELEVEIRAYARWYKDNVR